MIDTLLFLMGISCLLIMGASLATRDGIYQFSFWAAGTFFGFVFIQLVGLANYALRLPAGALEKTTLMSILCLLMTALGSYYGRTPFRAMHWQFSQIRLLKASAVLSLIGAIFFFQISRLPLELTSASQWSGITVAYRFFSQAMPYGMAIACLLFATTSSRTALVIFLFDLLLYLDRIFIAARRGETAELIVIFVLAFWFGRKLIIPRLVAVFIFILGVLFLYSTGEYRDKVAVFGVVETITSIDFQSNLLQAYKTGGAELVNTVYSIAATDRTSQFDFGAYQWNLIVFNFVPAQIFGSEFKNSLIVEKNNLSENIFGHVASTGSTSTGMADAFGSFWFFGALEFFLIAYVLSKMYKAAVTGNMVMQLLYMLMLVNALHTVTHSTNWFVSPWVHMSIFLLPALLYARTGGLRYYPVRSRQSSLYQRGPPEQ